MVYIVTFTINIPPMLAYIYHTWILWCTGFLIMLKFDSRGMSRCHDVSWGLSPARCEISARQPATPMKLRLKLILTQVRMFKLVTVVTVQSSFVFFYYSKSTCAHPAANSWLIHMAIDRSILMIWIEWMLNLTTYPLVNQHRPWHSSGLED